MELEERVAELERRLAALEAAEDRPSGRFSPLGEEFWALERLKEDLQEEPDGGVLFTGSVRLPTEEQYGWQRAFTTDDLIEGEWAEAAEAFAALGHPVRMRLLREIVGGRRTVAELTDLEGVGTSGQIYHHLRQLTSAGWLHSTGRGKYEVPVTRVVPLLVAIATTRP
ncbi:ArsR/SmtB family transcription factor [Streptomyces apocyni]|uniref:ArsR/SmtB family transcription factor n=1 Tax=Streptomyces apocyni TaxID=2654677 RepID=UPI0012E996AF|nr:helix-turn-helix domain-containing protein [Streptomyces apocyni]